MGQEWLGSATYIDTAVSFLGQDTAAIFLIRDTMRSIMHKEGSVSLSKIDTIVGVSIPSIVCHLIASQMSCDT